MSLEALTQIQDFVTNHSATAVQDIGGHVMTGAALMETYFPNMERSKKVVMGAAVGLLPDFDYALALAGLGEHRGGTHSLGFVLYVAFLAYNLNQEDHERDGYMPNLNTRIKNWATSRYTQVVGLGAGLHLALDHFYRLTDISTTGYFCAAGLALGGMIYHNHITGKDKEEKPFRMHQCVVTNKDGNKYFVSKDTQGFSIGDEHSHFSHYDIPDYVYPTDEGRELIIQKQKTQAKPSVWQRIDNFFLRKYVGLQTRLMGSK